MFSSREAKPTPMLRDKLLGGAGKAGGLAHPYFIHIGKRDGGDLVHRCRPASIALRDPAQGLPVQVRRSPFDFLAVESIKLALDLSPHTLPPAFVGDALASLAGS
jgi:hypothetical protein